MNQRNGGSGISGATLRSLGWLIAAVCVIPLLLNATQLGKVAFEASSPDEFLGNFMGQSDLNLYALQVPVTSRKSKIAPTTTPNFRYAYAFVIGGVDRDQPKYQNYLYGIYVTIFLLRKLGSKADFVIFIEIFHASPHDTLPDDQVEALARLAGDGLHIRYIPKVSNPSFYRIQLNKFRILGLTEYDRVMYLDADFMPMANLDYLFHETKTNGSLRENVVFQGKFVPCNGGAFILKPSLDKLRKIQDIIRSKEQRQQTLRADKTFEGKKKSQIEDGFDPKLGWGRKIQWKGSEKSGNLWDFNAASGDQGLLYFWTFFVLRDVSVILGSGKIENWVGSENHDVQLVETIQPFEPPSPIHCWARCKTRPLSDFVHFMWNDKPWFRGYPPDLSPSTKFQSPVHFWFFTLQELNDQYQLGIDVKGIRDDRENAHPGVSESRKQIGKTLTNLLD